MFMSLTHLEPAALLRRAGLFVLALLAVCRLATPVQAQSTTLAARSHTIQIAVIGDSVAHDLGRGMEDLFGNNVRVPRRHARPSSPPAWCAPTITIGTRWRATSCGNTIPTSSSMVMGGNDHQTHPRATASATTRSPRPGVAEYAAAVVALHEQLPAQRTRKVYWVSLPPVRSAKLTRAYRDAQRHLSPARPSAPRHSITSASGTSFLTPLRRLFLLRRKAWKASAARPAQGGRRAFHRGRPPAVRLLRRARHRPALTVDTRTATCLFFRPLSLHSFSLRCSSQPGPLARVQRAAQGVAAGGELLLLWLLGLALHGAARRQFGLQLHAAGLWLARVSDEVTRPASLWRRSPPISPCSGSSNTTTSSWTA